MMNGHARLCQSLASGTSTLRLSTSPRQVHRRDVAHIRNRTAFRDCDATSPLFRLYSLLIATELALKDHLSAYTGNHDLQLLAGRAFSPMPSGLSAQLTALSQQLGRLNCTSTAGVAVPINPQIYPGLRYLRHDADYAGGASDSEITQALRGAEALARELAIAGLPL